LQVGDNTCTLTVTAEDGNKTTYTVTVRRRSNDATLKSLTVSSGTLSPAFSANTTSYAVTVASSVASIALTGVASHSGATVAGGSCPLTVGANTCSLTVSAEDGAYTKTYTVAVRRLSSDAALQSLTVSAEGAERQLVPAFNPEVYSYMVNVENSTEEVSLQASARYPHATALGAGQHALQVGITTLAVRVASEDGLNVNVYRITIVRPSESIPLDIPEHDYTLNVSEGYLLPEPVKTIKDYTLVLPYLADSIIATVVPVDYPEGTVAYFIGDKEVEMPLEIPAGFTVLRMHYERDGVAVDYTISIYGRPEPTSDATLNMITPSEGGLTWSKDGVNITGFVPAVFSYADTVAYGVDNITLSVEKTFASDAVAVLYEGATANGGQHALEVGNNLFTVTVRSAEDVQKSYQVNVYRRSNDASLRSLAADAGKLSPAFAPDVLSYADTVAYSVESITLTGATRHPQATVAGNGAHGLQVGANSYTLTVTAEDDAYAQTYTVNVYRRSNDSLLSSLTAEGAALFPDFQQDVFTYRDTVAYSVESITLTGATRHPQATVADGAYPLLVGDNTCAVTVTAEDDAYTQIYTVNVYRRSNDSLLNNLTVEGATLFPDFKPDVFTYVDTVAYSVESVTLTGATRHPQATVADGAYPLLVGDNACAVTVTAEDNAYAQTYTVNIYRRSSDASLRSLAANTGGSFVPAFHPDVTEYVLGVTDDTEQVAFTATPRHPAAVAAGAGTYRLSADGSDDTITFAVTAEDTAFTRSYTVRVRRHSVRLKNLTVSGGFLAPSFNAATLFYMVTVPNDTTTVTLAATPEDTSATVQGVGVKTLKTGLNTFTVVVMLPNSVGSKAYTVLVTRASVSIELPIPDAEGKHSLEISAGEISPAPRSDVREYTLVLPCGVDTLTAAIFPPLDSSMFSTVRYFLNDEEVFMPLPMPAGVTLLTVEIKMLGLSLTYRVTVENIACSDLAALSSLTVSEGVLEPTFDSGTFLYSVNVESDVDSILLSATTTHPSATVEGNGWKSLNAGKNTFTVKVVAEDSKSVTAYTVQVFRYVESSNTELKSLTVSAGALIPDFSPDVSWYAVGVPYEVSSLDVTAEARHALATVTGNVQGLPLKEGVNAARITVTAEDGVTTQEYPVVIYRQKKEEDSPDYAPFDKPARLLDLSVSENVLTPAFDPDVADYSVSVDCNAESITVAATPPEGSLIAYVVSYKEVKMPLRVEAGFTLLNIYIVVNLEYVARYTLFISRSLNLATIIPYWDDVLAVNVNTETNGGYTFSAYQWYKDGNPVLGETGAYWYNNGKPFPSGSYSVEVTTAEGNVFTSCPLTIDDQQPSQKEVTKSINIYPNPVKTHITVETPQESGRTPIEIYSANGRREAVIYPSGEASTTINVEHLTSGSYILRVGDKSVIFIKE
jgi:hypothetical protein